MLSSTSTSKSESESESSNMAGYIHTFTPAEQQRLIWQAELLEPIFNPHITFEHGRVLEVGCGVGAQLRILMRRHPGVAQWVGIDYSPVQLKRAAELMRAPQTARRPHLARGSAFGLPFASDAFDGVCFCWVLEHLPDPVAALTQARRVLRPGGILYATEVFNAGVFSEPHAPHLQRYWAAFNAQQRAFGGDPDSGIHLANWAREAGFTQFEIVQLALQVDARHGDMARRRELLEFICAIMISASRLLVSEGKVDQATVDGMLAEYEGLINNRDSVFVYPARQLRAVK